MKSVEFSILCSWRKGFAPFPHHEIVFVLLSCCLALLSGQCLSPPSLERLGPWCRFSNVRVISLTLIVATSGSTVREGVCAGTSIGARSGDGGADDGGVCAIGMAPPPTHAPVLGAAAPPRRGARVRQEHSLIIGDVLKESHYYHKVKD